MRSQFYLVSQILHQVTPEDKVTSYTGCKVVSKKETNRPKPFFKKIIPFDREISQSIDSEPNCIEPYKEIQLKSGAKYLGEWVGNKRDGFGILRWQIKLDILRPDGSKYEGLWS